MRHIRHKKEESSLLPLQNQAVMLQYTPYNTIFCDLLKIVRKKTGGNMKRIGLLLSGGLGKGAYQIGALQAIKTYFKPEDFTCVSAASVGALNAYAYLTDSLESVADIWENMNFKSGMRSVVSIMRSSFLKDAISENVSDRKISCPFFVPLYDMEHHKFDYTDFSALPFNKLKDFLRAGVSLPVATKGVDIDGTTYFDGGSVDNIPLMPLLKYDLDYIICVYFDRQFSFENDECDGKIIKITFPDDTIIADSVDIKHDSIVYMMKTGFSRTMEILKEIFADGTENFSRIYSAIRHRAERLPAPKKRITMDVVISNLNRMMRKCEQMRNRDKKKAD